MKTIFRSTLIKLVDPYQNKGIKQEPFSLQYVKTSGEKIVIENVVCVSTHMKTRTMRIKFLASGEIRTLRTCSILAFNEQEIILK